MKIVFFGLSLSSSWGNGHATTYRALLGGLHQHGHHLVFFERNLEWYESNRDLPRPDFCRLELFDDWHSALPRINRELRDCDVAVIGSYFPDGVAAVEQLLNSRAPLKAFYDIDTPITVSQLREKGATGYLRASQLAAFDIYFSFTGGPILRELEQTFRAQRARPLYCSVDPTHYHRRFSKRYACDMSYMGTYAPDRQPKIDALLSEAARRLPQQNFLVAGPQYPRTVRWPRNVRRIQHLNPRWHPHLYSSSRFTLNVTRREMVRDGWSPSVRLFEAAACGATIISDYWPGLEEFFIPGEEILLPSSSDDVVRYLGQLDSTTIQRIGDAAQSRVLAQHTNQTRALEFEACVNEAMSRAPRECTHTSQMVAV